jgi:hypothetical protein
MAKNPQDGGELGFRKTYKMTGNSSSGGGPDAKVEKGASGSKRSNNAVLNQNKMAKDSKVGPGKSLKDLNGGNFY